MISTKKGSIHMDENLEIIRRTLKKYSQEHLLNGYERLDEVKQKIFMQCILQMNINTNIIHMTEQQNMENQHTYITYLVNLHR